LYKKINLLSYYESDCTELPFLSFTKSKNIIFPYLKIKIKLQPKNDYFYMGSFKQSKTLTS